MTSKYRKSMKSLEDKSDFNKAPAELLWSSQNNIEKTEEPVDQDKNLKTTEIESELEKRKKEEENLNLRYELISIFLKFDSREAQEKALKELKQYLIKTKLDDNKDFYSISETADILNRTNRTIMNWIADKNDPFTAEKKDGKWKVSREAIKMKKSLLEQ